MLVLLNNDRNRSSSNSSSGSTKKASSEKQKSKQSTFQINSQQKLNMSELIPTKQTLTNLNETNLNLSRKYNMPRQKVQELYIIFDQFDQDEDGIWQLSQFQNFMQKGHQPINITTTRDIIYRLKGKSSPGITFQDFITIILKSPHQLDTEEQLTRTFKIYDKKNKGYFTFEDYLTISKTISQQFKMWELEEAFNFMDLNKDGRITYEEFKKSVSRTTH